MIVKNVYKSYGHKRVITDVSFELEQGQLISFIGPNGAGKSTMLAMISGQIKADSGQILIAGKNINDYKKSELATKLSMLFQSNNIQSKITIKELVAFGRFPYAKGNLGKEDHIIVDRSIEYMDLKDNEHSYLDELSGGQRQRALIAMVLAQDTEYVLLDEPTNNLDIYHATNLMKTLRELCDDLKKTVIVVLHEINFASFYSDSILVFKQGQLIRHDMVNKIMQEDFLKQIYQVDFKINHINNKPLCIYY